MPDISLCPDAECPYAKSCARSEQSGTVRDPLWQSWLMTSPRIGNGCEMRLEPRPAPKRGGWTLERDADGLPVRMVR